MMQLAIKTFLLVYLVIVVKPLLASPDGEQLYLQNCAACHGTRGDGGVGVPLALPAFLAGVPDSYLYKTIVHGRPGRVMPAFQSTLDDRQIKSIVKHIRQWGNEQPNYTGKPITGSAERGKVLFSEYCASCHGANGEGGTGTGVTFSRPRNQPIIAPALNNPGFLKAASDAMIKQTLMKGRQGTPMVSFTKMGLNEQAINDIVVHVRAFEQQTATTSILTEAESPILIYESDYDFATTVANVKTAATGNNFRIIREQYLNQGMVPEGEENSSQKMVYFCNFNLINNALAIDPRVGLFMPCRVTVVEQEGIVKVMTINPKYLSPLFNNSYLNDACDEMYNIYVEILEVATL